MNVWMVGTMRGLRANTGQTPVRNPAALLIVALVLALGGCGGGGVGGQQLALNSDTLAITSTEGYWGGQFSNIPTSSSIPRAVAGTFGAVATSLGGSQGVFLGAYAAGTGN